MSKKVTRVESDAPEPSGSEWKPSEGAKGSALKLRLIALVLWLVAIGLEIALAFTLLLGDQGVGNAEMAWLIGGLVVIAILALAGSLLWKKANRYDPARRSEPVRFFIQNQLGVFIAVLAFAPLIVLVLMDKNMSKGQKGLAGAIAAVLMLVVGVASADRNPPSVEQYTEEQDSVIDAMGSDYVYWAEFSKVFHLCPEVSDLNGVRTDEIFEGTVAQAHEAGMDRLTKKIELERKQCAAAGHDVPGITDAESSQESSEEPAPVTE
jgi:hypothetical protein